MIFGILSGCFLAVLVGIIGNFIMGVFCSRLMIKSLSGFKPLRKKWLFGGADK